MQVKVTLTMKDEELKKIMQETGLTKPDEIKGYFYACEKRYIECEFGNRYDIDIKVDDTDDTEAVFKSFRDSFIRAWVNALKKPEVKEVKRPAKVGEYIKIVDPYLTAGRYTVGDILKVKSLKDWGNKDAGVYVEEFDRPYIKGEEYVVLEGYKPHKKPEVKEVKRPAKVGEYVRLTYDGLFKGRICKVREINCKAYELKDVAYVDIDDDLSFGYTVDEYVVLENYEPEDGENK